MSLTQSLGKQVGPMPLGAWLLIGAGGLFIAYRSRQGDEAPAVPAEQLPTAGGAAPSGGAIGSWDGAPVVLSPIIVNKITPPNVVVNNNVPAAPTPTPGKTTPPPATPRVPAPAKPAPAKTAPKVTNYTVRKGDTLWSIAARYYGSGVRWTKLYADNKTVIEAAAVRYGHRSSTGPTGVGHWIFPGTVLRIIK